VRTRLTRLARLSPHESREYNLCDSPHCMAYSGLQAESAASAAAARDTAGETLAAASEALAPADFHRACGGFTADGVSDGGRPLPAMTPFKFYAYTLQGPPDGMLCLADDKTTSSDVYWTVLLEPRWIEGRLNRTSKIGYIRSIAPAGRYPDGRVKALKVEGTAGSAVIEGEENISFALAAGTLRSTLFSIRPIYKGKYPAFFLLRGIGTGDGKGMCLLGAYGMAKARGAKYREILRHYFPYYMVKKGR
jgi:SpoIID/LytB domain protein